MRTAARAGEKSLETSTLSSQPFMLSLTNDASVPVCVVIHTWDSIV